ncbi:hypothetical protein BY458DRAFT_555563 [Sporodiniella umbellata]|nr:hypothetical protein BY458DRAFT_555563 [Sporodiniella umbellata]
MNSTQHNNRKGGFKRKRNQSEDIPESASKIKKRIRDVQRMLRSKDRFSAQAITESKRKLRTLQYELGEKAIDEKEKKMATKYHKVKHFERKKIERKINQTKLLLEKETNEDKKQSIQAELDKWNIKQLYTRHYPKTWAYVSLFPQSNEDDKKSVARKERILGEIKAALEKGDKELKEFNKLHRKSYRDKLIKKGIIVIEPLGDDDDNDIIPKEEKDEESEEDDDDFFEK